MSDIITVTGNVAGPPEFKITAGGLAVANFRLGSAQRRLDRSTGTWVDDGTNWYNVSAFRGLAEHIAASVTKGEPLVVTGRLRLRAWESGGKKGVSIDIDADTVGHDLRWGTSTYTKQSTAQGAASASETTPAVAQDAWAAPGAEDAATPTLPSETPF
ncbi:single-stranded DNA-binding protein [Microbacterium schleiferi]|uniref:Single-stranded DNA-binding protein n=1 Tax=Microbacterium schleiferi TaxID=69362 RepID=A0A7S8MW58_9MICO|nr:single-stranded DNA-binding protein [Microbacterium schleiferi]QPE03480.1 single-stranded DNA-binding protein [Microbacterium schleiferi]